MEMLIDEIPRIANRFGRQAACRDYRVSSANPNDFVGNADVLGWLLGREPTSLESFIIRK